MSPASRASSRRAGPERARSRVALYRAVGPAGSKLRRAGEISLTTPGLDLAARLRAFQRALRSRVERRDALIEIVRADGRRGVVGPWSTSQFIAIVTIVAAAGLVYALRRRRAELSDSVQTV